MPKKTSESVTKTTQLLLEIKVKKKKYRTLKIYPGDEK